MKSIGQSNQSHLFQAQRGLFIIRLELRAQNTQVGKVLVKISLSSHGSCFFLNSIPETYFIKMKIELQPGMLLAQQVMTQLGNISVRIWANIHTKWKF